MLSNAMKVIGAAALATAIGVAQAAADAITLNVAVPLSAEQRQLQEAVAAKFMAENPDIKLNLDMTSRSYDDLVQRNLRQAITGGLPDVAFHVYNRVRLLAERKLPVPLNPFIEAEGDMGAQGYLPSVLSLAKINGQYAGLPFNTSTIVVYYNLDLVKRAGGDPGNLPKSWPDITRLAADINRLGKETTGIYFDYYETAGNWTFMSLLESLGGRVMSADDKTIAFDGKEGMEALTILRDIGRSGFVDMTRNQARQAFKAGTLGIFVVSTSNLKSLTDGAEGRFEAGVGPFPIVPEIGRLPAGGNAIMMFTRDPAKQKAAWKYIKFATGPVGQTIIALNSGYMPNNTIAIEREDLLGGFYKKNPNSLISIRQLPVLKEFYAFPGPNSVRISDVIRDHLREVITLRRSPEEVMVDMVRDVKALLPKS
jgi:multiple sugar transport system substrate-binding protein